MKKILFILFAILFSSTINAQTYFYINVDKTPQDDYCGVQIVYFFNTSKICVEYANGINVRQNLLGDNNYYGSKRYESYRNKPADIYGLVHVCTFKNSQNNFNMYSLINGFSHMEQIPYAISYDKKSLVDILNPNKPFYFKLVSASDFMPNFNF